MYRLILKRHMDGEDYNNKPACKKRFGHAKYIVNLGKNGKTETKVSDRTKGGRDGY